MAKQKNEKIKCVVTPAVDNAHKEQFVKINGKMIVFGVPVYLTQNDIYAIKNIKEQKRVDSSVDVQSLMDKLRLPQEKVNKLLRENKDMQTKANVRFVPKYNVSKA